MREHIGKLTLFLNIMASVIGLGYVWRFPYLMGSNGGSAFLFLYVIAVFVLGIPLIFFEMYLGQKYKTTVMCLFKEKFKSRYIIFIPLFLLFVSLIVLSYYSVVTSWTLGYFFTSFAGFLSFDSYIGSALMFFAFFITVFLVYLAVRFGLKKGVNVVNYISSVLFIIFLFVLLYYAVASPGFGTAVKYMFSFNASAISLKTIVLAFAHALFSLSLGFGILLTYASYSKKENLNFTIGSIIFSSLLISVLIGIIIYSFLFSYGLDLASGPRLVFDVLTMAFKDLFFLGPIFFLLIFLITFTSTISLFELVVASFVDYYKVKIKKVALIALVVLIILAIPSLFSVAVIEFLDIVFGSYLTIFSTFLFLLLFLIFTRSFSTLEGRIYKLYRAMLYVDLLVLIILFIFSFFL